MVNGKIETINQVVIYAVLGHTMAKQNKPTKFLVRIVTRDNTKTKGGKQLAKHVHVVRTALLVSQVVYLLVLPGRMQMVQHAMHVQWVHTVLLERVHQQRG